MTHPEEAAAVQWMQGRTVEIGAGSNPTPGVHTTVDHTPAGQPGTAGCELGQPSTATITADMAHLPFPDGDYDTLIARHVLEHHPDTLTVLREWARVAHRVVAICPDQATYDGNTIRLDPTHKACFTSVQLAALAEHAGLSPVCTAPVIPGWSLLLVAEHR
jgi:SAM-dependent methyltransferase